MFEVNDDNVTIDSKIAHARIIDKAGNTFPWNSCSVKLTMTQKFFPFTSGEATFEGIFLTDEEVENFTKSSYFDLMKIAAREELIRKLTKKGDHHGKN